MSRRIAKAIGFTALALTLFSPAPPPSLAQSQQPNQVGKNTFSPAQIWIRKQLFKGLTPEQKEKRERRMRKRRRLREAGKDHPVAHKKNGKKVKKGKKQQVHDKQPQNPKSGGTTSDGKQPPQGGQNKK